MLQPNFIYTGDVLHHMRTFPDKSVDCIVTSPMYWMQRNYGWEGQWGVERTFHQYLAHLWEWADECWRVLKDTGSLWVNLGDTYMGGGGGNFGSGISNNVDGAHPTNVKNNSRFIRDNGVKAKTKLLLPHRFAIGCIERGWILRNDIDWVKPNGMAESVKDRFSNRKEYFFFMTKIAKGYYFDLDSIRDKHKAESIARQMRAVSSNNKHVDGAPGQTRHSISKPRRNIKQALRNPEECLAAGQGLHPLGRNPGDVSMFWDDFEDQGFQDFALRLYLEMKGEPSDFWSVATQGKKTDHFATYNPKLIHKPILAGWTPCGIILDPFAGTGTTVLHAIHTGRVGVGIEGNQKWAAEANANVQKMLSTNLQFA
jgi:DNA modification methylase